MKTPRLAVDRLANAYQNGRWLAVLLDYDGTLVPIVERPELAVLDSSARLLLEMLAARPRVIVGVISGRSIDNLKQMVGIPDLCYVGTAGLEIDWRGNAVVHGDSATVRDLLLGIAARLRRLLARYPGGWLEVKPMGLTLHYRQVAAETIERLRQEARDALSELAGFVQIMSGPAAIEIVPAVGRSKGTALASICARSNGDVVPFYAGDSDNDSSAFDAALSLGGLAVSIGPHAVRSPCLHLSGPRELIALLQHLLVRLMISP